MSEGTNTPLKPRQYTVPPEGVDIIKGITRDLRLDNQLEAIMFCLELGRKHTAGIKVKTSAELVAELLSA